MVNLALRSGVDKFVFKLMKNDSLFGNFIAFTNSNKDSFFTNSHVLKQTYGRGMNLPDIIFAAADLDLQPVPPNLVRRTAGFVNNAALILRSAVEVESQSRPAQARSAQHW